jgi:hypothetical protein
VKGGRKNWDEHETTTTNNTPQEGPNKRRDSTSDWREVGVQATTAILAFRNGPFEVAVVERVIFDLDGEAFIMRIDRWTLGDGPRF